VKTINNKFDEDLKEILELIVEKLREKYVAPFEEMVRSKDEDIKQNLSPEINLLNAFKPFLNDKCCDIINKVVSSYQVATVANAITDDFIQTRDTKVKLRTAEDRAQDIEENITKDNSAQSKRLWLLIIFAFLIILLETHQDH